MSTHSAATSSAGEVRPGELSTGDFLKRHWQRQPLLMRQALPGSMAQPPFPEQPLFTARELFALARNPDVESRLVHSPGPPGADASGLSSRTSDSWRLQHGPFNRLPPRRQPGWSLLVQGVDLHLPAGRALMDRFRFIPDARLDDLMISFATDGGGVGPHVDSYDVFLLQVHGRRRWRIAPPGPAALLPDAPLKILANFKAQQTWLLEPGDMLYLPPGWSHEGTAVGECMTCSIGFRSPSMTELRQAFFNFLGDQEPAQGAAGPARRYRDKTREAVRHPAEIPADMADTLRGWLQGFQPPAQLIERFIGCYLTEPKPNVWFEAPSSTDAPTHEKDGRDDGNDGGQDGALSGALRLDNKTRMLYRKDVFYINGEAVKPPSFDKSAGTLLKALADQRGLDAAQAAKALRRPWLGDTLQDWLASGWIRHAGR